MNTSERNPVRGSLYSLESEVIEGYEIRGGHRVPVYSAPVRIFDHSEYLGFQWNIDGRCTACGRRIANGCVFREIGTDHRATFGRHCLRRHAFTHRIEGQEGSS